jgi:hypothetical protein
LQKSPLLRAFLDTHTLYDTNARETVASEFLRVAEEMEETVRYSGETAKKAPLGATPALSDIFDPSIPHKNRLGTIKIVMSIGYEIGDMIEAAIFLNDIKHQLITFHTLSALPEKDAIIRESLMSALSAGVDRKRRAIEAVPKEFHDFINNLDIKGS